MDVCKKSCCYTASFNDHTNVHGAFALTLEIRISPNCLATCSVKQATVSTKNTRSLMTYSVVISGDTNFEYVS
jgi:hypothetical protein